MKIGIIPTVTEKNKSIYYSINKSLLIFLNKLFNKPKIIVLNNFNDELCDLIVSSGGNDLLKFFLSNLYSKKFLFLLWTIKIIFLMFLKIIFFLIKLLNSKM